MHGGVSVYTGSPAEACRYLASDRSRAEVYYLAEGTGVAEHYVTSPGVGVQHVGQLAGSAYEAWVIGVDPVTGEPKGRLRHDDRAVRFVEVTVNGPKSWSLAAALHPDIAAAYDAAQDRAAAQVIGWLGEHATTRVGGRGQQVQIPVEHLEAVTIRHGTSRAGDPHRHLHLQVNARVHAGGQWRGLHTVGVRDSLAAINGIGHAAVSTDPEFRTVLAQHGFTLDQDGEIEQLAPYVGAFSRRAEQIERNIDRYETAWTAQHPGEQPGPGLRRAWDARAWADGRPDKITPLPGEQLGHRWLTELALLGYRNPARSVQVRVTPVGTLDRDHAVTRVLATLAGGKSAWNAADIRGTVEQNLAAHGIIVDASVRGELAEDLTARALQQCVPLLDRGGVPEHIRALTSPHVLNVEADLTARLAARAAATPGRVTHLAAGIPGRVTGLAGFLPPADSISDVSLRGLDTGQRAAVTTLTSDMRLVVVEGAAGTGKTTLLAATREVLGSQGRELIVVTPTLKAAKVVEVEVGVRAGSAAWLAYQHGWRWDTDRTWTRLNPGDTDPVTGRVYLEPSPEAVLCAGDLLLVDEAGMLDQDTALALLTLADEHHIRVAFIGDRRQLAAVGRGGVLDLAITAIGPDAVVTLDKVHRFTHQPAPVLADLPPVATNLPPVAGDLPPVTRVGEAMIDAEYATLSLATRSGDNPGEVFDALLARGQIQLYSSAAEREDAVAEAAARDHADDGTSTAVIVDTRAQVAAVNAAIRDRLVDDGTVDDERVLITAAGERVGAGDLITTRRNDRDLQVANRDTWTVLSIDQHGTLEVVNPNASVDIGRDAGRRILPADYVARHVELGYACTAHGAQGDTVTTGHLLISEHTSAASAYVGMTRGRIHNTAHLVATDADDARVQWVEVFTRDRSDLGPAHAARQAAREVANYATPRPLAEVVAALRQAWTVEQRSAQRLAEDQDQRRTLVKVAALAAEHVPELAAARQRLADAEHAQTQTARRAKDTDAYLAGDTRRHRDDLHAQWNAERAAARDAARIVNAGPGPLRLRTAHVNRASEDLARWSVRWQPYLPDMPTRHGQIAAYADRPDHTHALNRAFQDVAEQRAAATHPDHHEHRAAATHPDHHEHRAAAKAADTELGRARLALQDTRWPQDRELQAYGPLGYTDDPIAEIHRLDHLIATAKTELTAARTAIQNLSADPAVLTQPPAWLDCQRDHWNADQQAQRDARRQEQQAKAHAVAPTPTRTPWYRQPAYQPTSPAPDHGISR